MYSIHDEQKVKDFLTQNKIPKFRYEQLENAIYKNFIDDFDKIETIPKDLRDKLKQNFYFESLVIDTQKTSSNGQTTKTLFKTKT
jgi:23S rRNA (adenine2503-C2)-methyltransferase